LLQLFLNLRLITWSHDQLFSHLADHVEADILTGEELAGPAVQKERLLVAAASPSLPPLVCAAGLAQVCSLTPQQLVGRWRRQHCFGSFFRQRSDAVAAVVPVAAVAAVVAVALAVKEAAIAAPACLPLLWWFWNDINN
jgi:hypothetical protein